MACAASAIISWGPWWSTSAGHYLLEWEQRRLDLQLEDLFGFHALQIGLAPLDGLRANRMPQRWLALGADEPHGDAAAGSPPSLRCAPEALPFPDASLDLVVLPHTLEVADDPHDALREVTRVLRPEGRLVVLGFNPWSMWSLRQHAGRWRQRLGGHAPLFLPRHGHFIGERRVRDWLRLLGLEVEQQAHGCWRPPVQHAGWLHAWRWLDAIGPRLAPGMGAAYVLQAVKRVRGMRLVGLARAPVRQLAPVAVAAPRSAARLDDGRAVPVAADERTAGRRR